MSKQTTHQLLMIRPANFGFNKETAANNAFQQNKSAAELLDESSTALDRVQPLSIAELAQAEFDQLVTALRAQGIQVLVLEDNSEPLKTDAVFPNNWVSFHEQGQILTYPMWSENRRLERRPALLQQLQEQFGFQEIIPLEHWEAQDVFLEGTGSMILDRVHKICYACTSARTQEVALDEFCTLMGYEKMLFQAVDQQGQEIYHTNVMMALGEDFVVIGLDTITNPAQKQALLDRFQQTNKTVVALSWSQLESFAGNMLQVSNKDGKTFLVLSQQARDCLTPAQVATLEAHTTLLSSPIPTIETLGGGSVRCMLAEVFLPVG
ncbi:MAG: citrulline utilization hydrolase CtlX [Aureispira sp.]